jgi:hypothetical protein
MADKTSKTLQWAVLIATLVIAIASPIIAVDRANNSNAFISEAATATANEAKEIALQAKQQGQDNAKDFEYFKGKLEGTIKGLEKGMDSMDRNHKDNYDNMSKKVDKLELKIDEVLKIMVRFKRADLDGE